MSNNKAMKLKAKWVMGLGFKRAGRHCPAWAREWKMQDAFFQVYKLAQWKNRFRHESHEVDHIVPLHGEHVSGLHVPWNLKVIRKEINRAKGVLIVPEWL